MAGRVVEVESIRQNRDGGATDREAAAVSGTVDAIGSTRHDAESVLDKAGGELRRDILAIGRSRPRSDDRRRPCGGRPDVQRAAHPESERNTALTVELGPVGEGIERPRPLTVAGADEPAAQA